jgi:hypothetical protein
LFVFLAIVLSILLAQYRKIGKPNNVKVFGSNEPKSLNGIAKDYWNSTKKNYILALTCYLFFITLTYDPDHLPSDGSLDVSHFQKFMKRLRKKISPLKIRFL